MRLLRLGKFATLALLLATLGSAIAVVWARHQSRELFGELTRMQAAQDDLRIDFGRLELEQATWAEPSRVEKVAREKLGMIDPPADVVRVLRR